jgi:hypothetical protein
MSTQNGCIQPPRIARWLVALFIPWENESLEGDLSEEFSDLVLRSGTAVARHWYWRQALRSVVYLFSGAFRTSPFSTIAAVTAGFMLGRVLFPLPEKAIFAILDGYKVFDNHFQVYVFFATDGLAITHVLTSMLIGCLVALSAMRKEMIATVSLVLLLFGMTCAASLVWVSKGNASMLWSTLPWTFLDWLAMLVGAAIIRSQRSASRSRL